MRERTQADDLVQGAANRALLDLVLPAIRNVARMNRYAVAVHGSLCRDIDLIAVPWVEGAVDHEKIAKAICGAVSGVTGSCLMQNDWSIKPHGRKAITLLVYCAENHMQIDLSVMPIVSPAPDPKP